METTAPRWCTAAICFVVRPACPSCGSEAYIAIRSMPRESDGSRTLRVVCKKCSTRYLIVSEPGGVPRYGGQQSPSDRIHP